MNASRRPISLWGGKPLAAGYRLITRRGQGGFGQVWEAESPDGRRIALKFIQCGDYFGATEEVRNILRVQQRAHPHLVHVEKVWADQGYVVVTMELAEGSLLDLLHLSRKEYGVALSRDHVCEYLLQAASALDFLNARTHRENGQTVGLQHCDIKPGNMLVCGDVLKLCDFGLASLLRSDLATHRRAGTLAYAAPEVFRQQLSQWTDQYSLAVSYYELRTGTLPFPRSPSRFGKGYKQSEPDLSLLPLDEGAILRRALSERPQDRWPTCTALAKGLFCLS